MCIHRPHRLLPVLSSENQHIFGFRARAQKRTQKDIKRTLFTFAHFSPLGFHIDRQMCAFTGLTVSPVLSSQSSENHHIFVFRARAQKKDIKRTLFSFAHFSGLPYRPANVCIHRLHRLFLVLSSQSSENHHLFEFRAMAQRRT